MRVGIEEIEINEDKTMEEFMNELQLPYAPILLEVDGKIYYPDEVKDRRLSRGDRITLIPLIAGG